MASSLNLRLSHLGNTATISRFWLARQVAGGYRANEILSLVRAVAKWLIAGQTAATKGDGGAATKPKGLAFLVDHLKIPFDAKRAVVENGYFSSSHRFLHELIRKRKRKAIPR
jgi:hypothetical protein